MAAPDARCARLALAVGGVALICCASAATAIGDVREAPRAATALAASAWAALLVSLGAAARAQARDRGALSIVLVVAIAARVILLWWHPGLSDDMYRYVWDGRILNAGHNPYSFTPTDPGLGPLRDHWWSAVNHKPLRTIYPPAAEMLMAGAAAVAPGPFAFKIGLILLDIALVGVLVLWLERDGRSGAWAVAYAWNPLVLAEVAGSGHLDPLGVLPLVGAVFLLRRIRANDRTARTRRLAAGTLLGVSVLGKYGAALLVPGLRRELGRHGIFAAVAVVVAGFLPFVSAGPLIWSSLVTYGLTWSFNGSVYALLTALLRVPLIARVLVAGALAWAIRSIDRRRLSPPSMALFVFVAALLLSPTVYPWYLLWPLPFAVVHLQTKAAPVAWAVLAWTATVTLSYVVLIPYRTTGAWQESWQIQVIEYLPVCLLLARAAWLARQKAAT
jgi:hypothetical protein